MENSIQDFDSVVMGAPSRDLPLTARDEQTALLQKICDRLEERQRQDRKHIRLLRICLGAIALIALVAVVVAATLLPNLYHTIEAVYASVSALDMQKIDGIITNVQQVAEESTVVVAGMGDALQKVNALDLARLNATIAELETTVAGFSEIDIPKLNDAIENLNATVEPLAKLFGKK